MQSDHAHDDHGHVHVTPFWPMLIVFVTLVVLTVITVLTAKFIDLPGQGNLILAMFIACIKGLLVAGFFMHLVYDDKMNSVVLSATMFCVALFIGLSLMDLDARDSVNRIQKGEITLGGSKEHVKAVQDAGHAAHGNHDDEHAEGAVHDGDEAHADDHDAAGHEEESHDDGH